MHFTFFFWGWNLYIKVKLVGFASNKTPFMETTQPVFSWADESFFAKPVEMLRREWDFWDILHVLTETFLRDEKVDPVGLDARVCCVQWGEDFVCQLRGPRIIGWLITRVFAPTELILVQALIRSHSRPPYFSYSCHRRAAYFRLAASCPFRHSIHSRLSPFYLHLKATLSTTYFSVYGF